MIVQDIYLGRVDWHVRIYYAVTTYYAHEILDDLIALGCSGKYLRDAQANLWAGKLDSGLTYSNMERHETVMVIAKASEGAEYWNSIDHEKNHLLQHIALTYEIDPYGEEISYISGELIRDIYRMAKGLLCDCCRKRRLQIL